MLVEKKMAGPAMSEGVGPLTDLNEEDEGLG